MSTRCNIIIDDGDDRIQLYRHHDGYPYGEEGVLATLEQAFPYALSFFVAGDFSAAIIRAWKKDGEDIYIDGSPNKWEMLHGDIEWVYVVKQNKSEKEPVVLVYDWYKYWFDRADLDKEIPNPIFEVELSKARDAGLNWEKST